MLHSQTRRRNRNSLPYLEACESRLLLTAVAIYPQPLVALPAPAAESQTVSPQADVQPAAVAADYAGSWDTGGGGRINLTVKGNKVKGTGTGGDTVGTAKIKGKITGLSLEATLKGKAAFGDLVGRSKLTILVTLTDSTHFAGIASGIVIGITIPPTPISATKL